jgi:hypothetical protein
MKTALQWFLAGILVVLFFAILIGWFWGIPYVAYMIYDGFSYWLYATVWLSIHLVRNIHGRVKAQNQLKKIAEVQNILGGGK